jgi:general secretion pathway protein D
VRVVAEESSNTLLLRATAEEWEWIQKILKDIDLRPLQVLIEAVIVEVTRTQDLNVGVDATVTHAYRGQRASADLPQTPSARDFLLQLADGHGTINFTAALNALASRGELRIRSLPVIVGQNNKQALLNVGSSRPFVSVSQTVPNDPTGRVQTTQYIDVGTKLQITPRINTDGYVNLEVAQTANSATAEIQFDAPVINKREATTQIFLRDGQTTVLGGLADNTRDVTRTGIPVLRDIPLLGGLFGSTHKSNIETELYVFLTPHIIAEDNDIDRLRDSLQQYSPELRQAPVVPVFPGPATPPPPAPTDSAP